MKGPQILAAIGRGQQEANLAAANCGGDIGDAGQRILDQEGAEQSFRQFAKANGIDMSQLFRSRDTNGVGAHCAGNARKPTSAGRWRGWLPAAALTGGGWCVGWWW